MIDAEMYARIVEIAQRLGVEPSAVESEIERIGAMSGAERGEVIARLEGMQDRLLILLEKGIASLSEDAGEGAP